MSKREFKKIFVLNLIPNTVGDVLFLTPLYQAIKKNFPQVQLHTTVSSVNADLLKNNPHLDKIFALTHLKDVAVQQPMVYKILPYLKIWIEVLRITKTEKYDALILCQPNFLLNRFLTWATRIPVRIGYHLSGWSESLLTDCIPFCDPENNAKKHYIETELSLLKPLGIDVTKLDQRVLRKVTQNETNAAKELLAEKGITGEFICIQAGAKLAGKMWPAEKFKELCLALSKKYAVILLGSSREYALNESVRNDNPNIFNFSGIPFSQTIPILALSRLLIGNDSGLTHLATAVGTDTVTLYGTTSYLHSQPKGYGRSMPVFAEGGKTSQLITGKDKRKDRAIMASIKLSDVLKAAEELLENPKETNFLKG